MPTEDWDKEEKKNSPAEVLDRFEKILEKYYSKPAQIPSGFGSIPYPTDPRIDIDFRLSATATELAEIFSALANFRERKSKEK